MRPGKLARLGGSAPYSRAASCEPPIASQSVLSV
jgi:hypothetical protein